MLSALVLRFSGAGCLACGLLDGKITVGKVEEGVT